MAQIQEDRLLLDATVVPPAPVRPRIDNEALARVVADARRDPVGYVEGYRTDADGE